MSKKRKNEDEILKIKMLIFNQSKIAEPEVRTTRIQEEKMAKNQTYNNGSINDSESNNFL
jgi:hypothetical protein